MIHLVVPDFPSGTCVNYVHLCRAPLLLVGDDGTILQFVGVRLVELAHIEGRKYAHVLYRNKPVCVYRLVTEAFLGPRPEKTEVRHLNDEKYDSRLVNLVYGTRRENVIDAIKNGKWTKGQRKKRKSIARRKKLAQKRRIKRAASKLYGRPYFKRKRKESGDGQDS